MKYDVVITVTNDLNYDQRMIRIANSLVDAGYSVLFIGRKKKKSSALQSQKFHQKRLNCFFEKGKLFYLEFNIRLFIQLILTRKRVVISVDLDTIMANSLVPFKRNQKWVFDSHEFFTEVPELVGRVKEKRIWNYLAQKIIPKVDSVWVPTEGIKQLFFHEYGINTILVRNFQVSRLPQNKNNLKSESKPSIIYQGMVNDGRGLKEAILAMHEVDATLVIVGDGDLKSSLMELVVAENLQQKVVFKGILLPEQLYLETQKATIGLNLLENKGLSYYFSLANKWSDYVQQGLPQINMALPEYLTLNSAFEVSEILNSLNASELSQKINQLLNSDEKYNRLASNSTKAAKEFCWGVESQKVIQQIQLLLD